MRLMNYKYDNSRFDSLMQENYEKTKIVMAIRTARTLAGMSQGELSEMLGISKAALARIETGKSEVSAILMSKLISKINDKGIDIDFSYGDGISVKVTPEGVKNYEKLLSFGPSEGTKRVHQAILDSIDNAKS